MLLDLMHMRFVIFPVFTKRVCYANPESCSLTVDGWMDMCMIANVAK